VNSKKAIVVGASSGIGRALAVELASQGYEVGLASRRIQLLEELQEQIPTKTFIKQIDLRKSEVARFLLKELIDEMGGIDLIILNSGVNARNVDLEWGREIQTIDVNVSGFVACACVAVKHFINQGSGHIVGISSIASLRGSASCPSYNASKAFVSNYMEGLRHKFSGTNIYITDIRPGLVDTEMVRGSAGMFWVATPEGASKQIYQAIKKRKKVAYITRRWGLIAFILKILPDWVYALRHKLTV